MRDTENSEHTHCISGFPMLLYTNKCQTYFRLLLSFPSTVFATQKVSTVFEQSQKFASQKGTTMRTSCSCSWISSQTAYYFLQDRNKTPDWARASLPHWHFVAVNKNWFSNLLLLTVTIHLRAGRVESKRSHSISPREVKQLSKIHSNGFVAEQDQGRSPRFPRHCPSALVFQIILIINIANIFSALPSTERCS